MWFLSPQYNVRHRTEDMLVVESSSGRTVLAIIVLALLLVFFPKTTLDLFFAGASLVALTYRRVWTLDKRANRISGRMYLLFLSFEDTVLELNSIKGVRVEYLGGQTHYYNVYLIDSDGERTTYTWRPWLSKLAPILRDLKHYLPPEITCSADRESREVLRFVNDSHEAAEQQR